MVEMPFSCWSSIEQIGCFHSTLVMGDNDKLGLFRELSEYFDKSSDIGIIERRIELIENTVSGWLDKIECKEQRYGGKCTLSTR